MSTMVSYFIVWLSSLAVDRFYSFIGFVIYVEGLQTKFLCDVICLLLIWLAGFTRIHDSFIIRTKLCFGVVSELIHW